MHHAESLDTRKAFPTKATQLFVRNVEEHCKDRGLTPQNIEKMLSLDRYGRHNGRQWVAFREGTQMMRPDKLFRKILLALNKGLMSTERAARLQYFLESNGVRSH